MVDQPTTQEVSGESLHEEISSSLDDLASKVFTVASTLGVFNRRCCYRDFACESMSEYAEKYHLPVATVDLLVELDRYFEFKDRNTVVATDAGFDLDDAQRSHYGAILKQLGLSVTINADPNPWPWIA